MKNILFVALVFFACNSEHPVERWVAEDEARPQFVSEIELNQKDLPRNKVVANKGHSSLTFELGHWEIVDLVGWFADFDAVMYSDKEDFSDAVIEARINTSSVLMPNKLMQSHIQGPDHFFSKKYPHLWFVSQRMVPAGGNHYKLEGNLFFQEKTIPKTLNVTFNGYAYPEQPISGWTVTGFVTQQELGWDNSAQLHSGRSVLADTIRFKANLRMEYGEIKE